MPHWADITVMNLAAVLIVAIVASFGWRIGGAAFDGLVALLRGDK